MEDCKENIWTCISRMLENRNKQGDKGYITRGGYCEIYKSHPTKMYGRVERMQNAMAGTRKRGIPHKRWRYEIGEDLNTVGSKAG
jgi:hypothetical protein